MDRAPLIESIPARWRGPLAIVAAIAAGVGLYLLGRTHRDDPKVYADPRDHFKHGSTGGERLSGFPYWIWQALPALFPDYLPGGVYSKETPYAPMGFIYEPGNELPIGVSKRNVQGMDRVFLNCAICHAGTWRAKPEDRPNIVLGMPANSVDLQAFERFLFQCATDERFTPERILSAIEKIGGRLDQLDENLLRGLGIYLMRDRVLLLRDRFAFMEREPDAGPGRVDTFNPPKVLLNFPMHTLSEREWVGNCDLPSIWLQRPRGGLWLHWDGNNNSVQERNRSAAFGTGAYPPSLDRAGMRRIEDWIMDAEPPKFPFPIDEARAAKGSALYQEYCAACHGRSGRDFAGPYVGKVTPVNDEPALLVPGDFKIPAHMPEKLVAHSDAMSLFLWNGFSEEARQVLAGAGDLHLKLCVLAAELNRAISAGPIFDEQRFAGVALSYATRALQAQNPQGDALLRFNRLLLQDAYPHEIGSSLKGVGTDRWRLDSYTPELAAAQNHLYAEYGDERFSHFRKTFGYANAPLDGLWLRAPYLHNGSVPTLRDLLEPAEKRPATFHRGYDVYDPEKVGWKEPPDNADRRYFVFDTRAKAGRDTGAFAVITALDASRRAVMLDRPLLRSVHLLKVTSAAGQILRWDIRVKQSAPGATALTLEDWPAELAVGAALDYSTPRERNEGNGNGGHLYGTHLSPAEKDDLVEFLKTF
jgi:hypothetical protein